MEISFAVSDLHFSFGFVREQARVPCLVVALGFRVSVSGCECLCVSLSLALGLSAASPGHRGHIPVGCWNLPVPRTGNSVPVR